MKILFLLITFCVFRIDVYSQAEKLMVKKYEDFMDKRSDYFIDTKNNKTYCEITERKAHSIKYIIEGKKKKKSFARILAFRYKDTDFEVGKMGDVSFRFALKRVYTGEIGLYSISMRYDISGGYSSHTTSLLFIRRINDKKKKFVRLNHLFFWKMTLLKFTKDCPEVYARVLDANIWNKEKYPDFIGLIIMYNDKCGSDNK